MPTAFQTALAAAAPASETPGLCVLLVEDDEADAYLITQALAAQPAVGAVVRAIDGVEALALVANNKVEPDIAFIDLHMPRKNGFNLLTALGDLAEPHFPMVVLTSSAAPTDVVRSRLRGALRVVTKVDTKDGLEAVLAAAIDAVYSKASRPPPRPPADVCVVTPPTIE